MMFAIRTWTKLECCPSTILTSCGPLGISVGGVRTTIKKHWNPNFKKLRAQKVLPVDLPNYHELKSEDPLVNKEELRTRLKERGIIPNRYWRDRPIYIGSTSAIIEPYVPPEGDGKVSVITAQGAKDKLRFVETKGKSMMALRKIRSFDEDFSFKTFVNEAQEIYIQAHTSMVNKDRENLRLFITERAFPEVLSNIRDKTIRWEFVGSLEPPRVVQARCTDVISKDNIFSQITVRFHTQQILVVYDRFGRLMHGSETIPKDVLEYIVFEKHLSNSYGRWRVHDKVIPDWMPPKEPALKTFTVKFAEEEETSPHHSAPEMVHTPSVVASKL